MRLHTITIILMLIITGCSNPQRAVDDVSSSQLPQDYYLIYKSWTGTSPGAGFTRTSLVVIELDLANSRSRKIWKSASQPEPMLPHDDPSIAKLIAQIPWVDLKPDQISAFRDSIRAWLNTTPPPTYNNSMNLGTEDGHVSSLTVSWGTNTVTTTINPRGGFRQDDPLNPPKEWNKLLESLIFPSKTPADTP